LAGEAAAQGAVRSVHGDWQIRCETPPGAQNEQCALMQSVTAEDRPNLTLVVIVLKTSDQKSRLMRVVAPLGVLIPSGLGLKIDNNDVGRAGFVRCLPNGCIAEVVMDDNLIAKLRNGQISTFIIFQTNCRNAEIFAPHLRAVVAPSRDRRRLTDPFGSLPSLANKDCGEESS
jgi:invasion protein IalB